MYVRRKVSPLASWKIVMSCEAYVSMSYTTLSPHSIEHPLNGGFHRSGVATSGGVEV
jgi:hypothetical protein